LSFRLFISEALQPDKPIHCLKATLNNKLIHTHFPNTLKYFIPAIFAIITAIIVQHETFKEGNQTTDRWG